MKTLFTFWLLFTSCLGAVNITEAQVNVKDSLALVDLYNSTNGPGWYNHNNWLTGPVKNWYGIYLTNDGKRVYWIRLYYNNLTGTIPSSLGDLSSLNNIDLHGNQLSGGIPPELGNLSNLTGLALSENQLSGDIPPELGNLTNLIYFDSYDNQLSGNIPRELGNLSNLSYLDLSDNQLSGNIPPELGNLTMKGSETILNLSYNKLSGNIPPELGNLSFDSDQGYSALDLSYNQLSGPIPPELGNLSFAAFGFLNLSHNQLSGSIPPGLGNLSNIVQLYLNDNQLSGAIPPELGNISLIDYSTLNLSNNQLSGTIPPELSNLSPGEGGYILAVNLNLSHNQLNGPIPPELGNLGKNYSELISLNLSHNQLSGPIPAQLGNFRPDLHLHLDFSNNQLSGHIPPELSKLKWLNSLHLDHNKLSGTIPSSLSNLSYLNSLDLSHNQFTFAGMELIAKTFRFAEYDWQMPIPLHVSNKNTLSVSAGGTLSNNTYVWYKRDKPGNITISGDSVFRPTESGTYFVKVRNKIAKDLRLVSRAIKYTAPSSADAIALNKEEDFLDNSFSVYPNPARNVLHIKANENASFSLIRADGKILLTSIIDKTGVIDISNIAAGVYYLRNNNTNASKKVSVTK